MSLAVITCYFNPCGYQTRRRNYELFQLGLARAGVYCLTVECAFPGQAFELPEQYGVVHVRAESVLWQKERLLNLAAQYLPEHFRYVAWLDCDILMDNVNWVADTVRTLQRYPIAQAFETCRRLGPDGVTEVEPVAESFAAVMARNPAALAAGRYDAHGHTGYGWAMRREIFDEVGLYEEAISGSADHFMAHAIFDDYGFCIQNALKGSPLQLQHLKEWGRQFHRHVRGRLGCVPGQIRHLWHGDRQHRRYFLRMHDITRLGYNPYDDIEALPGQPLSWLTPGKDDLKQYLYNYFWERLEDGETA